MARGVNKVILVGNLGNDPEVRFTPNGSAIANLSLATSESWKDRNTGQQQEKTEWHRVVIFGKLAEIAQQYLRKGSKVYIEGKLQTRKWQGQDGQDRYTTEVVVDITGQMQMLDSRQGDMGAPMGGYQQPSTPQSAPAYNQQQYSAPPQQSTPAYAQPQQSAPQQPAPQQPASQPQPAGNFDDFDDDIPF